MAAKAGQRSLIDEVHRTKPARIVKRQHMARMRFEHQMIVGADIFGIDPPAPRHAKVEDHRPPAVGMDQAILRAATKARYGGTSQRLDQVGGKWAAQIGTARRDADQPRAIKIARQSAYGGFDFG
jgi:hypothetical protein